jgi:hypothetical protein
MGLEEYLMLWAILLILAIEGIRRALPWLIVEWANRESDRDDDRR